MGKVPLKRGERAPGSPNQSPALPAILVLHPGLEHLRLLPCRGASRDATGASQVSSGHIGGHSLQGRVVLLVHCGKESSKGPAQEINPFLPPPAFPIPTPDRPRTLLLIPVYIHSKSMYTCVSRPWHSAPGSLSLLSAAPWRLG